MVGILVGKAWSCASGPDAKRYRWSVLWAAMMAHIPASALYASWHTGPYSNVCRFHISETARSCLLETTLPNRSPDQTEVAHQCAIESLWSVLEKRASTDKPARVLNCATNVICSSGTIDRNYIEIPSSQSGNENFGLPSQRPKRTVDGDHRFRAVRIATLENEERATRR